MSISDRRGRQPATCLLVLGVALVCAAHAQENAALPTLLEATPQSQTEKAPPAELKLLTNYVESGGNYLALTDGFGNWTGGYVRGVITQKNNIWNAEINGQHEFGDAGVYFGAGDTYNFNADWYGSLTLGSSAGGFFWPRFRADGFINRKWRGRRQLITTLGFGYYAAKDTHRDHSFFLGSTYYFKKPWILEEGVRFNVSNPGSVFSPAGFIAVTQGRNQQHYITLRAGLGKEAYQLIGPTSTITDFHSQTLTITWRQWVGTHWGVNVVADYYHNPTYLRGGTSFGFFKEF